jgi:hypothetical protein
LRLVLTIDNATDFVLFEALASPASECNIGHGRPALIIHSFPFPHHVRGALLRHYPLSSFSPPGSRSFVPTFFTYFVFPARFEELCSDLLERIKTPVQTALDDAKLSFKDIQEVVLVGGR